MVTLSATNPVIRRADISEIRQKLLNQGVSKQLKDLMKKAQGEGER
ncbi:MAG: hypothetical protein FD167_1561 [bacterium]|nr:MAG: hypothetical protein FD167_1561 [bacterium]